MSTHVGDHTCIQLDYTASTDVLLLSHAWKPWVNTGSLLCMSSLACCLCIALTWSKPCQHTCCHVLAIWRPALSRGCQTHLAVRHVVYRFICCHACYRCIQHEWSLFLVSFMSTPLSSSSPSLLFSWLRHMDNRGETFECSHSKRTVSDWSKQARKHTHLCNAASVGLTQVHPNK